MIAVIVVVVAIAVPAIIGIRQVAYQTASKNNVKQIVLGLHGYANDNRGRFPSIGFQKTVTFGDQMVTVVPEQGRSIHLSILPYIDGTASDGEYLPFFTSPADPTADMAQSSDWRASSYAANVEAFAIGGVFPTAFKDGISNTIVFAEHYAVCGDYRFDYALDQAYSPFAFLTVDYDRFSPPGGLRRATFADQLDNGPATSGNPPVSTDGWGMGVTFQAAPSVANCDWRLAQTPHSNGMVVGMADGAVRILSPGISPETYWALVTPAGGEILGPDWID
ncbi:MAG TPA: hypothetical protein VE988_07190 [Gemmataceae bacterium]|nr:hypothetical protein [Gemmataceae bacterium]